MNIEGKVKELVSRLTLEEKIKLLPTRQAEIPRLNIHEFYIGGEAAHGVAWLGKATVFPQPIGLSSSFDRDLMRKIGEVVSQEARAYYYMRGKIGGLMLWAPTVDMGRDPGEEQRNAMERILFLPQRWQVHIYKVCKERTPYILKLL